MSLLHLLVICSALLSGLSLFAADAGRSKEATETNVLNTSAEKTDKKATNLFRDIKFSIEGAAGYNFGESQNNRGFQTDATEIGAMMTLSQGIRAKILGTLQNLCSVDSSKFHCPKDWDRFLREAYIEINLGELTEKANGVTILAGRMTVESAPSDSGVLIDNNAPMFALTRVRTAYAVQIKIDTKKLGIFQKNGLVDEIMVAAIHTGPNDGDVQVDASPKNAPGGIIRLAKTLFDQLTLTLGLTHINYRGQPESRVNFDASYQLTDELKVFINSSQTSQSAYYENTHFAATVGLVREDDIGISALELSRVSQQFTQVALGYRWKITPTVSTGVEVRHDWCIKDATACVTDNTRGTFEVHYMLDQIADSTSSSQPRQCCTVGDPGCQNPCARPTDVLQKRIPKSTKGN